MHKELFHGAELPKLEQVVSHSREARFELLHLESLRSHYPRTIDAWVSNLEKNKEQTIRATSLDTYQKFMKYLTGAAKYHRSGETNVYQFLFRVI
ncbi:MAG: class I SAM-dependent methyltransferase [Chloroflexi bacterium]|nr:class I SAM-dependent methyltransferase [Chloroflexota bacterium]